MIVAINAVVSPPASKGVQHLETDIEKWQENVKFLREKFALEFPPQAGVAFLITMMPREIKEQLTYNLQKSWVVADVLDKVRLMASNRTSMTSNSSSGRAPMDVDEVHWEECEDEECEVGAVGPNTQCYNCSGYGHFGQDCPSQPKGKGKGKTSGGKPSSSKGSTKGSYSKGMGKGKQPFTGDCFNCGKNGHRAADCRSSRAAQSVEETEPEEVECGGIWLQAPSRKTWTIASVEERSKRTNRFNALMREDEENLEAPPCVQLQLPPRSSGAAHESTRCDFNNCRRAFTLGEFVKQEKKVVKFADK
jgi:hypothetical protein